MSLEEKKKAFVYVYIPFANNIRWKLGVVTLPAAFEGGYHEDGAQHGGDKGDHDQHRYPGILRAQLCNINQ